MLLLTIIKGPDRGKTFTLPDDEPQLIGRSSEALLITDNTVSRRHAELTPDAGRWYVRDLQSHNGTYVNGVEIEGRTPLQHGDQIRVGSTVVAFGEHGFEPDTNGVVVVGEHEIDAEIERTLVSNEDSVLMAAPEPRTAAVDHLRVIYRLTTLLTQATDTETLLRSVMELVFAEFEPERGVIILVSSDDGTPRARPVVVKYKHPPKHKDDARIQVSSTILDHVMRHGEGVLSSNAMSDPRFRAGDSVQRYGIRSAVCCPIRFRENTYGAIYIDSSIVNYTFTEEQLALLNAVGQHTGLTMTNTRLTADKINRERLAAIGETIASLSHSIKNILQGLRGGADVLEMGLRKGDLKIAAGGWGILRRNVDRIMALTQNMLAYSRQRTVDVELTKLGPLLEDCASLLEGLCKTRQVALLIDADTEMPPIPIDPHLMHQALLNLMTNAVEAVEPKRGVVTVRTVYHPTGYTTDQAELERVRKFGSMFGRGPEVEILVIDNGPGIAPERRDWVFEPFNTTKGIRGTGLGLAVTGRVIKEHRGRVEIIDGEDGVGAIFRIILPADASKIIDPSETTAAGKPGSLADSALGPTLLPRDRL